MVSTSAGRSARRAGRRSSCSRRAATRSTSSSAWKAARARRDGERGRLQSRSAMIPEVRRFASWLVHRWRGSLQIRVAATTLVLSAIVSLLLGVVLLQQIRQGLINGKTRAALAQLDFGLQHAADQFNAL